MNQSEAVKVFDLVVKEHMLPATMDKLVPLSFIGSAAVKFYQAKVRLMDQLGATEAQRKATLADGQDAGEMLLNIEARIGELYEAMPSVEGKKGKGKTQLAGQASKIETVEKLGIPVRRANKASEIHRHPAAVKAIIKEARENEDIPTKTAVLNKIRADKAEAAQRAYKEGKDRESSRAVAAKGEAAQYLSKLREVVTILPASAPKEGWSESSFAEAQAMVGIIRKRLEAWS